MDFITIYPKNQRQHGSIMIGVDKLTKFVHVTPVKYNYKYNYTEFPKWWFQIKMLNLHQISGKNFLHVCELILITLEVIYGRKCTPLISWDNWVERIMTGPQILHEMEHMVKKVQYNLKVVQDRQKFYED